MNDPTVTEMLARATEAATLAVWPHVGGGSLESVDRAAVDAMRTSLNASCVLSRIAIGEGEKDEAPMLHNGELLGRGTGEPVLDLAVDPIDGTRAAALGHAGSVAALAAAPAGAMIRPTQTAYMQKLVGSPKTLGALHLDMPVAALLAEVAKAEEIPVHAVRVAILDRPRNRGFTSEVLAAGAHVHALPYADLSASIAIATGNADFHLLLGIGGAPEGVIAATAAAAVGATMQGRLWPRNDQEREELAYLSPQLQGTLCAHDMVGDKDLRVVLTGVTGSEIVEGGVEHPAHVRVHTIQIASGAPVRFRHQDLSRKPAV